MPADWDGKKLPQLADGENSGLSVELEVCNDLKRKIVRVHRPDSVKQLFFDLHKTLRHETMRQVILCW